MNFETFVELLDDVHQTSYGVRARCPAHDDRDPSMGATEGDDGRILVHCFAGCTAKEICGALGLQLSDLFRNSHEDSRAIRITKRRRGRERQQQQERRLNGLRLDVAREAERLIQSARSIDISGWRSDRLDRELNRLADAYLILEEEANGQYYL